LRKRSWSFRRFVVKIPSSNFQLPRHSQIPISKRVGTWRLGVPWKLGLGGWDLDDETLLVSQSRRDRNRLRRLHGHRRRVGLDQPPRIRFFEDARREGGVQRM